MNSDSNDEVRQRDALNGLTHDQVGLRDALDGLWLTKRTQPGSFVATDALQNEMRHYATDAKHYVENWPADDRGLPHVEFAKDLLAEIVTLNET